MTANPLYTHRSYPTIVKNMANLISLPSFAKSWSDHPGSITKQYCQQIEGGLSFQKKPQYVLFYTSVSRMW